MRETKADLLKSRDDYRQSAADCHAAIRYLACGIAPDFEETVRWRDKHGGDFVVTLRGYGLHRADGGTVVQIWGDIDDHPVIACVSTLKITSHEECARTMERSHYQLADAYERLRRAMIDCQRRSL